jgi:hypothetical protein
MPKPPRARRSNIDTPLKGQISRFYQSLGGCKTRGAAAATARKFHLPSSHGPARVKLFDAQIRDGTASRSIRRPTGRPLCFDTAVGERIDAAFVAEDTITYREAGEEIGLPASTLHRYATSNMDYRCLGITLRARGAVVRSESMWTRPTPSSVLGSDFEM